MASINWMKSTTQKACGLKKHLGEKERKNGNHSNEHINTELSYQNYTIGCEDYAQALEQMKTRTKDVDAVLPPKRIRQDRVTCCFLELPCPRILTEQGMSEDFFQNAHKIFCDFFGADNVHGTFVHKDEVHPYVDKDGIMKISCEHSHTLVSAYTSEKGINGKAFETRSKIKALNTAMDDMCLQKYGIHLNTGETPERKTVETLKNESAVREELKTMKQHLAEIGYIEAEYQTKKAFINACDEKSDISNMYPDYAQKKKNIFGKEFVTVPVEKWEERHISAYEKDVLKKALTKLEDTISPERQLSCYKEQENQLTQEVNRYLKLNKKYKMLEEENKNLNDEINEFKKWERFLEKHISPEELEWLRMKQAEEEKAQKQDINEILKKAGKKQRSGYSLGR